MLHSWPTDGFIQIQRNRQCHCDGFRQYLFCRLDQGTAKVSVFGVYREGMQPSTMSLIK
jgi:hypothetical protein